MPNSLPFTSRICDVAAASCPLAASFFPDPLASCTFGCRVPPLVRLFAALESWFPGSAWVCRSESWQTLCCDEVGASSYWKLLLEFEALAASVGCVMSMAQSIGHPYIHAGVHCDGCFKSPVRGYRYKCQRRADHDLCAECYYRQSPVDQQGFLKIERADDCLPFQIHYIECDGCGAAPIQGPRYHHRQQADYDLCATCFQDATSPTNRNSESADAFEIKQETLETSNRTKRHPVYHFEVQCNECQVTPICGPRYNSTKNFQYDLCLVCFDTLLVNGRITASQFRRMERPDLRTAVHVFVFSCNHCGATPICGPAYINNAKPNKVLCLLCYLNIKPEKQDLYTRVEPPRQLNLKVSGATLPRAQGTGMAAPPAAARPYTAPPAGPSQMRGMPQPFVNNPMAPQVPVMPPPFPMRNPGAMFQPHAPTNPNQDLALNIGAAMIKGVVGGLFNGN